MFMILMQLQRFCKEENSNLLSPVTDKKFDFKLIDAKEVQTRY